MNKNFNIENNESIIKISKTIYDKKVLIQASYVKLDEFYFLIDEDEKNYFIFLKYKNDKDNTKEKLTEAVYEFFNELIESASYIDQLKRTSGIRTQLLEAALFPHQANKNKEIKK